MAALILCKIPYPDATIPVAADKLALIRMYDHIVHRTSMPVVPLHSGTLCIPDLDRPVLGRRDHPFCVAVKANTSDIASVSLERENRSWIVTLTRVELDVLASGGSDKSLVWRDAETIDLGVGVGYLATTEA